MTLRLALRGIRRQPATFAAIVVAVAVALAATAALFSVLDGLLFRPLPFPEVGRLVVADFKPDGGRLPELAYLPELAGRRAALRDRLVGSPLVADAAEVGPTGLFDRYEARALGLDAQAVDARFFALFALPVTLGRTFTPDDEIPAERSRGATDPPPVVIGHGVWRRVFGGDPEALGVRQLAGRPVRIVGVMAPGVKFPGGTNVWVAASFSRGWPPTYLRLAPGATIEHLAGAFPELRFRSLRDVVQPGAAGAVPLLFGAALLLLTVTWVQVVSLVVSGAPARLADIGLRRALGAGRAHLLREAAVPSALMAAAALALAWLLVGPLTGFIIAVLPEELSRGQYLSPDVRTLVFTGMISLVGFVLLALGPLGLLRHASPLDLLRGGGRSPVRAGRTRQWLLALQMTLTALLLHVAGLGAHSFAQAVTVQYGFDTGRVIVFTFPRPPSAGRTNDQRWTDSLETKRKVEMSLARLPAVSGVIGAASVFSAPLGIANQRPPIAVESADERRIPNGAMALGNAVSADFVRAMGATLVAGSSFDAREYADRDDVVLVNEAFARMVSPILVVAGQETALPVVGRVIQTTDGRGEIIGIIKDFIDTRLDVPTLPQYFRLDRRSLAAAAVFIRLEAPVESALPAVRGTLESIWGPLAPRHFTRLDDEMEPVLAPYRGQAILLGLIVACCLPVAAVGLAGALMHAVRLRRGEIAVRIAMGADPRSVRQLVVRQAIVPVVGGLAIGTALGAAAGRLAASQLFQVQPLDPVTIGAVAFALGALGWLAALGPARQACRVDPAAALREG